MSNHRTPPAGTAGWISLRTLLLTAILAAAVGWLRGTPLPAQAIPTSNNCGDGSCQPSRSEDTCTCPQDCGSSCGDGCCNGGESSVDCPEDCGTQCGDGACNGDESTCTCIDDCGSLCGDGCCNKAEDTTTCPDDCGTSCGDGVCNGDETFASCAADCGIPCGDCDDANACTQDECNLETGACVHRDVNCNDNDVCTTDSCDAQSGCTYTAVSCDDGNACTQDSCDSTNGCTYQSVSCDDFNPCTVDSCNKEVGCVYQQISCDDGDPCTADSCDAEAGCVHEPICAGPDTFLCYDTTTSKKAPKFTPVTNVPVGDLFEDLNFTVAAPREICNPVGMTVFAEGGAPTPQLPTTPDHLNRYQITAPKKAPRNMQKNVEVDTQFGNFTVDLVIGDKLFVPTAKAIGQQPQPLPTPYDIDHYKCYDVKPSKKQPKFPKGIQVSLVDQFLLTPQTFTLTNVSHLCTVAQKYNEPVLNPCGALMCFDVAPVSKGGKFKSVTNVFTADQFGPFEQDTVDYDDLCVPASTPFVHGQVAGHACAE